MHRRRDRNDIPVNMRWPRKTAILPSFELASARPAASGFVAHRRSARSGGQLPLRSDCGEPLHHRAKSFLVHTAPVRMRTTVRVSRAIHELAGREQEIGVAGRPSPRCRGECLVEQRSVIGEGFERRGQRRPIQVMGHDRSRRSARLRAARPQSRVDAARLYPGDPVERRKGRQSRSIATRRRRGHRKSEHGDRSRKRGRETRRRPDEMRMPDDPRPTPL